MIEFTIKGQTYSIFELTIKDYYKVQHLIVINDFDSKLKMISELSNCDLKLVKLLDKLQFAALWNSLVETELNLADNSPFHKSFVFKDVAYHFLELGKMTIGEFADMETIKAHPNSNTKLHYMMAIIYRPALVIKDKQVAEPYDSDSLEERAQLFLDLPMKYVVGALNFFLQAPRLCLKTTKAFSTKGLETKKQKEIVEEVNRIIQELPDLGTEPSASSQEMTLQKLTRLHELLSSLRSTTLRIERTNEGKKRSTLGRFKARILIEADNLVEKYRLR